MGSREGGAGGKMGFGSVGASRIRTLRGCQGRWVCLDGEERGRGGCVDGRLVGVVFFGVGASWTRTSTRDSGSWILVEGGGRVMRMGC